MKLNASKPEMHWKSREEWAKQRTTIYLGDEMPKEFLRAHDTLVPDSLRAGAVAELEALWKALGPHIRGAQRPIVERLYAAGKVSAAELIAYVNSPADDARSLRHDVRDLLKRGDVRVPVGYDEYATRLPVLAHHPTHSRASV
jgi:hypothetical protein